MFFFVFFLLIKKFILNLYHKLIKTTKSKHYENIFIKGNLPTEFRLFNGNVYFISNNF